LVIPNRYKHLLVVTLEKLDLRSGELRCDESDGCTREIFKNLLDLLDFRCGHGSNFVAAIQLFPQLAHLNRAHGLEYG
jgi:hypothetical protein